MRAELRTYGEAGAGVGVDTGVGGGGRRVIGLFFVMMLDVL